MIGDPTTGGLAMTVTPAPTSRSDPAARMRRSRPRKRGGHTRVPVDVPAELVAHMVRRGLLPTHPTTRPHGTQRGSAGGRHACDDRRRVSPNATA